MCYNIGNYQLNRRPTRCYQHRTGQFVTADTGSGLEAIIAHLGPTHKRRAFAVLAVTHKKESDVSSGNFLSYSERKLRNEMWLQGQIWCSECKQFLPIKEFSKDRSRGASNYGYRYYCVKCENEQKRNPVRLKAYYLKRNKELKEKFVILAGGKCHRCGFDKSIAAMDFHHVYPSEKKYNPASLIYGANFEKTWLELDKCCMLCANCHNSYTAGEWKAEFIKRDGLGWTVGEELPLDDGRYEVKKVPIYHQAMIPDLFRPISKAKQIELW